MATLNNQPLSRIDIDYGPRIWTAKVSLINTETLSPGTSVTINIEGQTFVGYILRGGAHLGRAHYVVSGGGGGWRMRIAPPELRSGGFIRLYTVIDQILSAANAAASANGSYGAETVTITEPDKNMYPARVTFAGSGAYALDALGLNWRVLPNGSTRIGPDPGGTVDARKYAVQAYDPAHRWAMLAPRSMSDAMALFDAIGGSLSGDPFTSPFQYSNVKLALEGNSLRVEVEA